MRKLTKSMWLRRVSPLSLAGALVFPLALQGAANATVPVSSEQGKVYEAGQQAKQTLLDNIEMKRRNAMLAAGKSNYATAMRELEECAKQLSNITGEEAARRLKVVRGNIIRVKKVWCSETMREARKLAGKKDYKNAIARAQSALAMTADSDYIVSFINECKKNDLAVNFRQQTAPRNVMPDFAERRKQIDLNLREAKLFFRNKRYESACNRLERVLKDDPFNVEAIDLLALSYNRLFEIGVDRSRESNSYELARDVWEWVEPLAAIHTDESTSGASKLRDTEFVDLQGRLEKIYFPTFQFKNTPLHKVIGYLNEKSREYDPEKQGVTIIDRLKREDKNRRITMDMGRMPLSDILHYLSMETNLAYAYSNGKVVFGQVDNFTPDSFPVSGAIIGQIIDGLKVRTTSSGMKDAEASGGDNAPADSNASEEAAPEINATAEAEGDAPAGEANEDIEAEIERRNTALKKFFTDRGITFDDGASINYNEVEENLEVRNTPENLRRIGELLRQLNALKQPMVMVEVKMIELTDTNLNELGFEWLFNMNSPGNTSRWSLGTNSPIRNGSGGGMFRVINGLKILPNFGEKIFGSDTSVNLELSVNAVAQNRRAEVLASPRILTESAPKKPAMIQMTEKTYFITEWEQPDIDTDGLNISIDSTDPEWDDDAQDLGVTFSVKPTVQADNYTITLNNIHPVFLTHIKDHDYVASYEAGIYENGTMTPINVQTFNMRMPEFSRREITTNISLYDGETVLIGGMADNETLTRDDKWPILGEIPLIGRLFTDKMSNVTNRTMLMFITARLVNPDGTPVRPPRDTSVLDFKR